MKKAIEIIGQELRFYTENKDIASDKSEDYKTGFIDGLLYLHGLFCEIHLNSVEDSVEELKWINSSVSKVRKEYKLY